MLPTDNADKWRELTGALISRAPFGWVRAFVNFEVSGRAGDLVSSYVAFYVRRSLLGRLSREEIELSVDEIIVAQEIGLAIMSREAKEDLTYDFIIKKDGSLTLFLDFEPPTRLSADLSDYENVDSVERHRRYDAEDDFLKFV